MIIEENIEENIYSIYKELYVAHEDMGLVHRAFWEQINMIIAIVCSSCSTILLKCTI